MRRLIAVLSGALGLVGCGSDLVPDTLCPDVGPTSTTALILDTSDPLAPHQLAALEQFRTSLVDSESGSASYIPKGHLLVVYELPQEGVVPVETFRMCNPGHPDECSGLDTGQIICQLRWIQFNEALRKAFPPESGQTSAPTSPIIETIRHVRNKEFSRVADGAERQTRDRTLLIVSDLLQNSDLLSHYRGPLPEFDGLPQRPRVGTFGYRCRCALLALGARRAPANGRALRLVAQVFCRSGWSHDAHARRFGRCQFVPQIPQSESIAGCSGRCYWAAWSLSFG